MSTNIDHLMSVFDEILAFAEKRRELTIGELVNMLGKPYVRRFISKADCRLMGQEIHLCLKRLGWKRCLIERDGEVVWGFRAPPDTDMTRPR